MAYNLSSGHWLPNQDLLWQCGQIFLAELAIDVAKHAVVGKFNEIRPGVYREFMKVSDIEWGHDRPVKMPNATYQTSWLEWRL